MKPAAKAQRPSRSQILLVFVEAVLIRTDLYLGDEMII